MKKKVVLVTGASSGLGKDFAKALAAEGMTVYAAARRLEKMKDLKKLGITPLPMDITKERDVQAAVKAISKDHDGVDVLINNAGFGLYGPMEEISIDDARYQFEVNLFGLARLTQLLLPAMRAKGAGTIINISSVVGKAYMPLGIWYHATKHALEGWSDCLRLELQQFGIDVVIIEPGLIKTEFGDIARKQDGDRKITGPYAPIIHSIKDAFDSDMANSSSEPKVITDLVLEAVRAKRPKTRYVGGKFAKPMLFMRRHLSDRMFDKAIMSRFRIAGDLRRGSTAVHCALDAGEFTADCRSARERYSAVTVRHRLWCKDFCLAGVVDDRILCF